jgi:VCBS repeat-containing protein
MERTWGSAVINWTTTTWTYTTAEATVALAILDSATPYVTIQTTQGTNWPATITVTYEPA